MNFSKTIIISPSGNFYGSEQVLFDFLMETQNLYTVFVPGKGRLIEKLTLQTKHEIRPFKSLKRLYLKVFFLLLSGKKNALYTNEGGHIRYLKMLASIFRNAGFYVHIRIVEDTDSRRIGALPKNLTLLSISNYLTGLMPKYKPFLKTIYDPYTPKNTYESIKEFRNGKIRVGIIGRVTETKGLPSIGSFCDFLERENITNIQLHFFGDIEEEKHAVDLFQRRVKRFSHVQVEFHGFVENKVDLYGSIDIVVHFNKVEPLGRIFFESLDYGIPFIGFNAGGIGEIAMTLGLEDCMICDGINWEADLYSKLINVQKHLHRYQVANENRELYFSASRYCRAVEELIMIQ